MASLSNSVMMSWPSSPRSRAYCKSFAAGTLFVVLIGSTTLMQVASAQQVGTRSVGDQTELGLSSGAGLGAQSRNIYGQKQLSAHRMMHFGKRPSFVGPPSIFVASRPLAEYPIYQTALDQLPQQEGQPMIAYNPMEQESYDNQLRAAARQSLANKQLVEVVGDLLALNKQQECTRKQQQQQQLQQDVQLQQHQPTLVKFMKLVDSNEAGQQQQQPPSLELITEDEQQKQLTGQQEKRADDGSSSDNAGELPQEHSNGSGQEPGNNHAINLVNRSLSRANMVPRVSQASLTSLLFGRRVGDASGSMMGLGSYIKKAEPAKMTFMHFG